MMSKEETEPVTEPVRVYGRLKPECEDTPCIKVLSSEELCIPQELKGTRKELRYKFKHLFTSQTTQREIFDHIGFPLLDDLLEGKNGLLFTYGITGSGKTYTLTGKQDNPGIIPKCIYTIFNSIEGRQAPKYILKPDRMNGFEIQTEDNAIKDLLNQTRTVPTRRRAPVKINFTNDGVTIPIANEKNLYSVFVTYVEIYDDNVYDLLDESSDKKLQKKTLKQDSRKTMYVNGVIELEVKSAQEAFEAFNAGQSRKKKANTCLNSESSRSHSIFSIRVVQFEQEAYDSNGKLVISETNVITISQLSLVDLAGSERNKRTQNTGVRLKEAGSINNSLMTLRTCIETLRENQNSKGNKLVPYRDRKLTYLFKNYFEGDGSVQMIVCINPSIEDLEENLHVLKFAELSQDVMVKKSQAVPTVVTTKTRKEPATGAPAQDEKDMKQNKNKLNEGNVRRQREHAAEEEAKTTKEDPLPDRRRRSRSAGDEVRRMMAKLDKENILMKQKIAMLEKEQASQAMKLQKLDKEKATTSTQKEALPLPVLQPRRRVGENKRRSRSAANRYQCGCGRAYTRYYHFQGHAKKCGAVTEDLTSDSD